MKFLWSWTEKELYWSYKLGIAHRGAGATGKPTPGLLAINIKYLHSCSIHSESVYTWVCNDQGLLITGANHTVAISVIRHFHISCENNCKSDCNMGTLYMNWSHWERFRDLNDNVVNCHLTIFLGGPRLCQLNQLLIPSEINVVSTYNNSDSSYVFYSYRKRLKVGQPSSVSLTSHFFRGFPLLEVICFRVPGCTMKQKTILHWFKK